MRKLLVIVALLPFIGAGCLTKETVKTIPVETEVHTGQPVPTPPAVFADQGLPTEETAMNFDVVKTESTSKPYTSIKNSDLTFTLYTHNQEWLTPASTTVNVSYPLLDSAIVGGAKFSQALYDEVMSEVTVFRGNLLANANETTSLTEMGNYLDVNAVIVYASPKLITAQITVNNYFAGAAHPNGVVRTINFDLENGQDLTLDELFINNSKYLTKLADLVRPKLVASINSKMSDQNFAITIEDEWLAEGTEPVAGNYQNFLLTKNGLQVLFDPYQVAAYALGPQTVLLPYSLLSDILQPGLLATYGL